ncbi:MAG: transcription antitermination factor NusB [Clostridiales bacterium]|nr:transcription antitermination factor NusB [Clostridiales bacterium]
MTRRQAREHLFIMLFRKEFHKKEELLEQVDLYFESSKDLGEDDLEAYEKELKGFRDKDIEELRSKFSKILEKLDEIDETISSISTGWNLNRMGKVDLTVMRIAVYEIKFDETIPDVVSVNEAVEIAKKFGEETSGSFVNGVLAKLLN